MYTKHVRKNKYSSLEALIYSHIMMSNVYRVMERLYCKK